MVGTISVPEKILNTLFEDYEATVPGECEDYEAVPAGMKVMLPRYW